MTVLPTFSDLPISSPLKDTETGNGMLRLEADTVYTLLHIRGITPKPCCNTQI